MPTPRNVPSDPLPPPRTVRALRCLIGALLLAGCGALLDGGEAPASPADATFVHTEGELLLASSNCTACHAADPATLGRIQPLAAPALGGIGWRATPEWLTDWLDHGCGMRPGTRMPDMFHDLTDAEDKAEVIDELVHYLMSLGGGFVTRPTRADDWEIERGGQLFDELGCRACHDAGVNGALAAKTDLPRLTEWLMNPLRHRPSGLMPDFSLSNDEARALSSWLLADQHARGPSDEQVLPGLEVFAYELANWPSSLPDLDALTPASVGSALALGIEAAPSEEQFALRFLGELHVQQSGELELWISSDDGSRLWIDGQLVIDHDGLHSPSSKRGTVSLDAGWHALRVEMFEASGGQELDAGFIADDGSERSFRSNELRHRITRYAPLGHDDSLSLDRDKAWWGAIRFKMRRCGACHEVPDNAPRRGPDLDDLSDLTEGCLADAVPGKLPDYRFNPSQRSALREVLARRAALRQPLPPAAMVDHALARLDCLSCHARDGRGGPVGSVRAAFVGSADLGDEGRLPPDLTGVGGRLRPDWLARVLQGQALGVPDPRDDESQDGDASSGSRQRSVKERPYMHARMPLFGSAAVAPLVAALPLADPPPPAPRMPALTAESVAAGRTLAGDAGLDCIACHGVAGHPGTGLPGLDLEHTVDRMTWQSFHQWLSDPIERRAGTRMPSYFDDGRSVLGRVLEGDAEAQIGALWNWLSLAPDLPLPTGLVVDASAYERVPVERPSLAALFMDGLSARVLAVGFPERLSYAYDVEACRLGLLWRGDFLELSGTWHGRAGQLQAPAGHSVRSMPPGPALALLNTPDAAWPTEAGRAGGWRSLGRSLDDAGVPTLSSRSSEHDLRVDERLSPVLDASAARFVRLLKLSGAGAERAQLRAAVAKQIEALPDGSFRTDDGLTLSVRIGAGRVRTNSSGQELIVAPPGDGSLAGTIEVELSW